MDFANLDRHISGAHVVNRAERNVRPIFVDGRGGLFALEPSARVRGSGPAFSMCSCIRDYRFQPAESPVARI